MINLRIKASVLICFTLLLSYSSIASENLFHLDYRKIEAVARDYIEIKHPEYIPSDVKLRDINLKYKSSDQYNNIVTVVFYNGDSSPEMKSVGETFTIIKTKKKTITLHIDSQGEVTNYSEGISVSTNRLKNK